MYVITNSAMDFADGAQRFNWCACNNTRHSPGASLAGLGDVNSLPPPTPIFDFSFWGDYFKGGGSPTAVPAVGPTGAPAAGAQLLNAATSYLPLAIAAAAAWYLFKGGKR